jgi:flagellar biosynthetic protein FlhB
MSDGDEGDKQFDPTQKRLDDARKKGDIVKSNDLITAAGYGGFVLAAIALGSSSLMALGETLSVLLDQSAAISFDIFAGGGGPAVGGLLLDVGTALLPWFGLPAALAALAILGQRGLVFAPTKLAPKLSRISPLSNAKNKFGRSGLFEFLKSFTKLVIYSVVLGVYLARHLPDLIGTLYLDAGQIGVELARLSLGLLFIVLVIATSLGVLDYVFQQAEHTRKNRMSRKEVMDEMKESDGDPAMKHQRRQKAVSIAMNQMLAEVPTADVVIVNPTHYAVALKWDKAGGRAPVCVAKGVDEVAAKIREIASENAIPLRSDPPTARAVFATVEIGEEIRPDHYAAVAAAIRFAEAIRQKARGK